MEMKGSLKQLLPVVEGYVKALAETILLMKNIINKISNNPKKTKALLKNTINVKNFPEISFDDAINILKTRNQEKLINFSKKGRDISWQGEIEITKALNAETPLWLMSFDRDRVPFYQKPNSKNTNKAINADLLFPPIAKGAFGGEIAGAGQRQDNPREMRESLRRQSISAREYKWYINLRKLKGYKSTSGFGLGIERFIAWSLGREDIKDVILYPRIKGAKSYP
jgi:asparaginyl-tRNA synthetase